MTNVISEDALQGQQSRIMNALKATVAPTQQQLSPQDLLQASMAGNRPGGNYLASLKDAQTAQAQNNVAAQTGIYNQMKEQVARGNTDAAAVDKAISDIAGEDPKIYANIATQLHNDPETVTAANVKSKVMKVAAEQGINPLVNQQEQAKTAKIIAEANQTAAFNPNGSIPAPSPSSQLKDSFQGNSPAPMSGKNEDYLSTLPAATGTQVKAIAEGRMAFPSGMALKTPYWQGMLNAVSQYDPGFDAVNYNARSKTRNDFTSGKGAQNITSLNTAMGHLDSLDKAFAGLKNSDYPAYNYVANAAARAAGKTDTQAALKDVNTKAIAVAGELAKVFRSTGMSQKEIEDWKDQISSSNSPAENKKVIESAVELMNSRLDAIGQQYNQGMGTTADPITLLSPKAQKAYERLLGGAKQASEAIADQSPEIKQQLAAQKGTGKVVDYTEYFR